MRSARGISASSPGSPPLHDDSVYDRVILSPGIDPSVPLVQNFLRRRIEMIGELELAYEMCRCPIVAHHRDERKDHHHAAR